MLLWHDNREHTLDPAHTARLMTRLKRDVLPLLGDRPIRSITPPDVLAALRMIETRGALEICRRAKQSISQIFRFAVANGWAESDPTACLAPMPDCFCPPNEVAELFAGPGEAFLRGHKDPRVELSHQAVRQTFGARTKEIRFATADEFEGLHGAAPLWRIPAEQSEQTFLHEKERSFFNVWRFAG